MDTSALKILSDALESTEELVDAARAKIRTLQNSIKAQVDVYQAEINLALEELETEIAAALKDVTLDDFADVDTARALYVAGWNGGLGSKHFYYASQAVTKGTYLNRYGSGWVHGEEDGVTALAWSVAIPKTDEVDDEVLARTADYTARIYTAAQEILGSEELFFNVMEYTCAESGGWYLSRNEEGDWATEQRVYGQSYDNFSHKNLREVFRWMSENIWYDGDTSQAV